MPDDNDYHLTFVVLFRSGHTHTQVSQSLRRTGSGFNPLGSIIDCRLGLIIANRLGLTIGSVTDSRIPGKKRGRELSPPTPVVLTDGDLAAIELSCYRVRDVVGNPPEVLRDLFADDRENRLALLVAHLPGAINLGGDDDLVFGEFHIEAGTGLEPVLGELVLMC